MRKQLAIILAALFLFVGIGLSFHHHETGISMTTALSAS